MVSTGLAGTRERPEETEYTMSAKAVAIGILDALERNVDEVALGAAANLRAQREVLFEAING